MTNSMKYIYLPTTDEWHKVAETLLTGAVTLCGLHLQGTPSDTFCGGNKEFIVPQTCFRCWHEGEKKNVAEVKTS